MFVADFKVTGKTKDFVKILRDSDLEDKTVLAVTSEKTDELLRSTDNLANVKLVRATYLNVFDIMNADAVLFDTKALKAVETWLLGETKTDGKESK